MHLNERDKQLLDFSGVFEDKFLRQTRDENRSIEETLDLCWTLMSRLTQSISSALTKSGLTSTIQTTELETLDEN